MVRAIVVAALVTTALMCIAHADVFQTLARTGPAGFEAAMFGSMGLMIAVTVVGLRIAAGRRKRN